nr:MAG TPA: hypothetical protein [Microviridae sp.]
MHNLFFLIRALPLKGSGYPLKQIGFADTRSYP